MARSLDAKLHDLATSRRVRVADDVQLVGLVGEAVAELELHRQDPLLGGR